MSSTNSAPPPPNRKQTFGRNGIYIIVILAMLAVVISAILAFGVIVKLRSDRDVFETVMAGATRAEIEAKYGAPRFQAAPGRTLSDDGWNGGEKDTISRFGLSVYRASPFLFIICEFDDDDQLQRVWIWRT
jgi:hypothetical protein